MVRKVRNRIARLGAELRYPDRRGYSIVVYSLADIHSSSLQS